jgi:hypothetical protein
MLGDEASRVCQKCQGKSLSNAVACSVCGAPFSESANTDKENCPKCGRRLIASSDYCTFCGLWLSSDPPFPIDYAPVGLPDDLPQSTFDTPNAIASTLLVCAITAIIYFLFIFNVGVKTGIAGLTVANLELMNQRTTWVVASGFVGLGSLLYLLLAKKPERSS